MSVKLVDLLSCTGEAGRDWFPLSGCKSGRIRISAEWKPVAMAGSLHGLNQYRFPIGVVRLNLIKATDVKYVISLLQEPEFIGIIQECRGYAWRKSEVFSGLIS